MDPWLLFAIWVDMLYTVGFFTITVKVNPWYRFCENSLVGVSVGYSTVLAIKSVNDIAVTPLAKGNIIMLIPIVLGFLLFTRYIKPVAFLRTWPIALMIGVGSGVAVTGAVSGQIVSQITATYNLPLIVTNDLVGSFNNILYIILLITTVFYFIFTIEQKGRSPSGILAKIGRYAMIVAFGVTFGTTMTQRINTLIERLTFLIHTWLGI